jgi:hypothetical protein
LTTKKPTRPPKKPDPAKGRGIIPPPRPIPGRPGMVAGSPPAGARPPGKGPVTGPPGFTRPAPPRPRKPIYK